LFSKFKDKIFFLKTFRKVSEYTKVKKEFEIKSDQLKIERIRLLQQKVREKVGKSVNMHMIGKWHHFFDFISIIG